MKKIILSTVAITSLALAGGDIAPTTTEVTPIILEPIKKVSNWNFEFSPYFAMSSISGNSGAVTSSAPLYLDFDDILDSLEFGTSSHFEAHNSNGWGFGLDYNYISLGASGEAGLFTLDVKQAVFEGYAIYRQELSDGNTLDYLLGIRNWRLKLDAEIYGKNNVNNIDNSWVDAIIGAKWTKPINENWEFYLKGDVGAGESALTASASIGFRYDINKWLDVDVQYKALLVDYETGEENRLDYFKYDTSTYGPVIGLNFKF
jgi:hypothetical protein